MKKAAKKEERKQGEQGRKGVNEEDLKANTTKTK